jgi:hypothetical protein
MSILKRLFHAIAWLTIFLSIGACLTGLWWQLGPHHGIVAQTKPPLHVNQSIVLPGTLLSYTVKYCVDESLPLPITIDQMLELQSDEGNPIIWPIAPQVSYIITQRCETKTQFIGVPSFVPGGRYHLHAVTSLPVNPIRTIKQTWQSNDFTILSDVKLPVVEK